MYTKIYSTKKHFMRAKMLIIFCIFCLLIFLNFSLLSCSAEGIVSVPEQIAIFENLGFIKLSDGEEIVIDKITISPITLADINADLTKNNYAPSAKDLTILYLPGENSEGLDCILGVYEFYDSTNAQTYYSLVTGERRAKIYLYKNYIVEQIDSEHIMSPTTAQNFYERFVAGLKNL
jgi:hypothetical protein